MDHLVGRVPLVAWHRPGRAAPDDARGIVWQPVDILDRAGVVRAIAQARPSRVFHVAGASRLDTAWVNVVPHLETNVLGTHHVLEALRDVGGPCRIVIVSSAMVYRVGADPIDESAPLLPGSPYGLTKLAQDQRGLRAFADDGLDVVIARPFNHVGPRQTPGFAVSNFARQIALIEAGRGEPEIRVGNLDARRDLTDVRDVADAYERLMQSGTSGRAYNICSGKAVRMGDVLEELLRHSRTAVRVVTDESRLRPNDMPIFVGDATRIEREVGWRPRYSLSDTLRDTLDWWRAEVRA